MTDAVTLRMEEWHRYDPISDEQVIRLLAITGTGTFSGEWSSQSAEDLRDKRKRFREYVTECIEKGISPHEVDLA
jgi:hypothetical protein